MEMNLSSELLVQQSIHISPHLIAASHILELSSMELQEVLHHEMEANPALEITEHMSCPRCGSIMLDNTCHTCERTEDAARPEPATFDQTEAYMDAGTRPATGTRDRDEEYDPLSFVAAPMTVAERLIFDLRPLLASPSQERIAEYLIGNLDDSGFLRCTVGEVASSLDVTTDEVEHVLTCLQTLEPIGIGARDLQECLLIQLRYLESQGSAHPIAYRIVADFLPELGAHKYGRIAHTLKILQADVIAAAHYIRDKLSPYPGQQHGARPRSAPHEIPYVLPDIVIRQYDDDLEVEILESRRFVLRISPAYQGMWQAVASKPESFSEQDREHIRHYASRAKMFMANLNQRYQTMHKIASFVAEYQREFLLHGVRHLRPLTRALAARYTGMHESTVSRATAGKWVTIPSGKVIPFGDFFTPALNVKDVMQELIAAESTPLTDQRIVEILAEQGYQIARRTVAKYRDQLGILPASLRD